MKTKRTLALLLAVSLTATAFVGCSKGDGGNSSSSGTGTAKNLEGKTVTFYNFDNPDGEELSKPENARKKEEVAKIKADIEKKYNCQIAFADLKVEDSEIPSEIAKQSAAGKPIADVIRINNRYVPTLINSDVLNPATEEVKTLKIATKYTQPATFKNTVYGFANSNPYAGEGLIFNADMIKKAGMEKLPNEMFKEGKWSYTDFYNYLSELKSKLPTTDFPFYIDPYYWSLFTPSANNSYVVNENGKIGYLNEGTLEAVETLKKVSDAGLIRHSDKNKDGQDDFWGTPANTFEKQKEVVMTHRAFWQLNALVGKFDFGFVPYPWGSQVTVNGDYKTLSDGYKAAYYDTDVILTLKNPNPVADVATLLDMAYDYRGEDVDFMKKDYEDYESKGKDIPAKDLNADKTFNDELSVELFNWQATRTTYEAYAAFSNMAKLSYGATVRKIISENQPVRPSLESIYQADAAKLKEAGYDQ